MIGSQIHNAKLLMRHFRDDRSGSFVIFGALLLMLILGTITVAIDFSRVSSARGLIQRAADGAAATAARFMTDQSEAKSMFDTNFKANLPAKLAAVPYSLIIDDDAGTVTANIQHFIPASFARVFGYEKFAFEVSAIGHKPVLSARKASPEEARKIIEKTSEEQLKKQIMAQLRNKIKQLRRKGIKIDRISDDKLEKLAEQFAKRAKR